LKTEYTPGPWTVEEYDGDAWWIDNKICREGICIAYITTNTEEGDANLIAAAPDLLEALEILCDSYGGIGIEKDLIGAYAIIAKAKGENLP